MLINVDNVRSSSYAAHRLIGNDCAPWLRRGRQWLQPAGNVPRHRLVTDWSLGSLRVCSHVSCGSICLAADAAEFMHAASRRQPPATELPTSLHIRIHLSRRGTTLLSFHGVSSAPQDAEPRRLTASERRQLRAAWNSWVAVYFAPAAGASTSVGTVFAQHATYAAEHHRLATRPHVFFVVCPAVAKRQQDVKPPQHPPLRPPSRRAQSLLDAPCSDF